MFAGEEAWDVVGEVMAAEAGNDVTLLVGTVEEEESPLVGFVTRRGGHVDRLHSRRIDAGVVHLGADGHGRGSKVLYLFQAIAHVFHLKGEVGHVTEAAARVAANEIRDKLITQSRLLANLGEATFCLPEKLEGGLPHQLQHMVRSVLRCYLQTATGMMQHHLTEVVPTGIPGLSGE